MMQFFSLYSPRFPVTLAYMLQSSEYHAGAYLKWLWRTRDFSTVQHRKQLDETSYAKMLLLLLKLGMALEVLAGLVLIMLGLTDVVVGGLEFGLALIIIYPLVWSHLVVLPLELGKILIVEPNQKQQIKQSADIFHQHQATKIAVAGSYGKTSMKEVLSTVLAEGKNVAATIANENVPVSHAKFARQLSGREDILIIEYGEGEPGDISRFAEVTNPTHAVITGLAPAHLNRYKTLDAAGQDIFSLADYLKDKNVYANGESELAKKFLKPSFTLYSQKGVAGWKVSAVKLGIEGLSFTLSEKDQSLELKSMLLGRHQIGVLSLAAVLAKELGLTNKQIEAGVAKTKPFEHRMQPYPLSGAWVIDDTYNGNIDGIKAGTELLAELTARRKIYVTPGLVEQGEETAMVHKQMGKYIAAARPDLVVLMNNSVCQYIQAGMEAAHYMGQLRIEDDPLNFYANLEHFVAKGDLVLMQNDWTDNYA